MSRRGSILQDYGNINHTQTMEAQHNAAQYYQRDKEQANELAYKNKQAKAKEGGDAIDYIGGLKADHVGDTTIDQYNDAQIKGLQDKLMGMMQKGSGVNEIKMTAIPELQKIAQGYTLAKNEYGKVVQGVKDLSKDYPTGDTEAARNIAGKEVINNIFEFDDKGNVKGYKDPSLISTDKNYMSSLTTNQNLPKWYRESGSFEGDVKKLPLIPVGGKTSYTDKYGKKVMQSYTGHGSVFDEPVTNDAGEQTGFRLKAESVPLGRNPDGSLIIASAMPKEQFELATSSPAAKLDFQVKFNKQLEESGVNPDALDPRARDVLERKFAYDLFDRTGLHGSSFLTVDEKKEAPIKNITNVHVNNGSGKPPVPVMDIVTPVNNYFETHKDAVIRYDSKDGKVKTISGVAPLNVFNNAVTDPIVETIKSRHSGEGLTANNIYYRNIDGTTWVMIARTPDDKKDGQFKINPEEDTPAFKLDEFTNVVGNKPGGIKPKNQALIDAQKKTKTEPIKTVKVKGL